MVIKETEREAARLRKELNEQFDRPEKVEILAWPGQTYQQWFRAVADKTEAFGEASGHMMNLVLNETMFVVEFKPF